MQSSWNNPLKALPFLLLFFAYAGAAFGAAGSVQFVIGDVKVITKAGVTRALQKGAEINEGDRVITAANASAQIKMVDGGFIAIRPNTSMAFDTYHFSGKEDGSESALISLARGGFRAITGLIGHTNKKNYLIKTETATIGIRGTDHEPMVILPPAPGKPSIAPPGTYDKVNVGAAFIRTDAGSVDIQRNQVGFAPAAKAVPVILPKIPSFYKPTPAPAPKQAKEEKKENGKGAEQKAANGEKAAETKKEQAPKEAATSETKSETQNGTTSNGSGETTTTASSQTTTTSTAETTSTAPADTTATTTAVSDTTIRDTAVVDTGASVAVAPATTATVTQAPAVVAPVVQITATDAAGTTLNTTTQTTTSSTGTSTPVSPTTPVTTNPVIAANNYDFGIMAVKPVAGGVERSDFPTKSASAPNTNFLLSNNSLVEILKTPYERFGLNYQAQAPIAADVKFSGGVAADTASDPNGTYYLGRWVGGQIGVTDLATTNPVAPFADALGSSSAHWIVGLTPGNVTGTPPFNAVQQLIGTANYMLAASTHPTDALGNVGTLNAATLAANFTAQTVDAGLNLSFSSGDPANPSTRNLNLTAAAVDVPIVRAGFDAAREGPYAPTVYCSGADCAAGGYGGNISGAFLAAASGGTSSGAVGTGAGIGYGFTPSIAAPAASQPFTDFIQGVAVLSTTAAPSNGTAATPVSGGTGTYRHQAIGAQTVGNITYNSNYNLASGSSATAQNYLFDAAGNLVRIQSTDYKLSERGTSGPPSYTDGAPVPYTGSPGSNPSSPLTGALVSFSGGSTPDGNYNDTVNGIRIGRYEGGTVTTTDYSNPNDPLTYYTDLGSNSFNWAVRELPASIPLTGSVEYSTAFGTKPTDSLGNVGTLNYASLSADFNKQVVNPAVSISIDNQNLFSAATDVPIGNGFSFDVSSNPANNANGGSSAVQVSCYGSNCAPPPVGESRAYGGRFTGGFAGSGTAGGAFFRYDFNTRYDPAIAAGSAGGIPSGETRPVNDYIQGEVAFTKGADVLAPKPADASNGTQAITTAFFAPAAYQPGYYELWGSNYQAASGSYTSPFGAGTNNQVSDYDPTAATPASETISGATVAVAPTNANSAATTGISFGRYTGGTVTGNKYSGGNFNLANEGSYVWIKGPQAFPFYLDGGLTGKATYTMDGGTAPAVTSATAAGGTTGTLNSASLVVDFSSAAVGADVSVTANSATYVATTGGTTLGSPKPTLKLQGDNHFFGSTYNASRPELHEGLNVAVNGSPGTYYQAQINGQLMGPGLNGAGFTYAFQDNSGTTPGVGINGAVAFALGSYTTNGGTTTTGTTAIDPNNVPYMLGIFSTGMDSTASTLDDKYLANVEGGINAASRTALDATNGLPLKWDGEVPIPVAPTTCTTPCVSTPGFVAQSPARFSIDPANFVASGTTPGSGQVALPTGMSSATVLEAGYDPATGIRWGRYGGGALAVFDRVGGGFAPTTVDLTSQSWHGIFGPLQTGPTALPATGTYTYTKVGGTSPTDNLGSTPGMLNAATLVANFGAQTVNAGVNLTVNGQTWAAGANAIPIQGRLHFEASKDLSAGNLNICVGSTCGTATIPTASSANTTGRLVGGFTGSTGQGAGMAYSLNQGTTTISGVAAFRR